MTRNPGERIRRSQARTVTSLFLTALHLYEAANISADCQSDYQGPPRCGRLETKRLYKYICQKAANGADQSGTDRGAYIHIVSSPSKFFLSGILPKRPRVVS